jgi:hypothetical protein
LKVNNFGTSLLLLRVPTILDAQGDNGFNMVSEIRTSDVLCERHQDLPYRQALCGLALSANVRFFNELAKQLDANNGIKCNEDVSFLNKVIRDQKAEIEFMKDRA